MTEISYEASAHRVRVDGSCVGSEAQAVCEAIETFSAEESRLTLDLTRVTRFPHEAAEAVVASVETAESCGCQVTIVRKHDSEVDRAMQDHAR